MRFLVAAVFAFLLLVPPVTAQDDAPDVTEIVAAHTNYKNEPGNETRSDLLLALSAYDDDATNESVLAYADLVAGDAKSGDYKNLRDSALSASEHTEPVADIIPQIYSNFRILSSVALFRHKRKKSAMLEMAHAQGFARQIMSNSAEDENSWARYNFYKANAWVMAMGAYFDSRGRSISDNDIQAVLAEYGADRESLNNEAQAFEYVEEETGKALLPFCEGELSMRPKLKYPSAALTNGMVGAVIIGLSTDDNGNVIDAEILASVPIEGFKEEALRTVSKWSYEPKNKREVGKTCRLDREDIVIPLVFSLE